MAMECLFCKIVKNEIPSKKLFENDKTIAILDINPSNPGHSLVIPKKHAENIFDIDENTLNEAINVVKNLAENMNEKLKPAGINIIQNNGKGAGQLVKHIHFHVIPRYPNDGLHIAERRVKVPEKQLDEMRKKLKFEEKKRELIDLTEL